MLQYGHWVIKKPEQESALLATAPPAAHISLSLSRQRSLGYAAAQPGLRRFALSRLAYAVAQPHVPLSHTAPQPSLHRRTHSHLSGVPPTFHLSAFSPSPLSRRRSPACAAARTSIFREPGDRTRDNCVAVSYYTDSATPAPMKVNQSVSVLRIPRDYQPKKFIELKSRRF